MRITNDGRTLKDGGRAALANWNDLVMREMSILGGEGKAGPVKDLAEAAAHQLAMTMGQDDGDPAFRSAAFQPYQDEHGVCPYDCGAAINKIFPSHL